MFKTTETTTAAVAPAIIKANVKKGVSLYTDSSPSGRPIVAKPLDKQKAHSLYLCEHEGGSFEAKVAGVDCYAIAYITNEPSPSVPAVYSFAVASDKPKVSSGSRGSLQNACEAFAHAFGRKFSDSTFRAVEASLIAAGYDKAQNQGTRAPRGDGSGAGIKAGRKPTLSVVKVGRKAFAHYLTGLVLSYRRSVAIGEGETADTASERYSFASLVQEAAEHFERNADERRTAADHDKRLDTTNRARLEIELTAHDRKVIRLQAEKREENERAALSKARSADAKAPSGPRVDRMRLVLSLRSFGQDNAAITAQLVAMTGATEDETAQAFADASA